LIIGRSTFKMGYFRSGDRLLGAAEIQVGFGADFNENQAISLPCHYVYLPRAAAVVGFNNAVTPLFQEGLGHKFAYFAFFNSFQSNPGKPREIQNRSGKVDKLLSQA
jgi:hypothetical protein